MKFVGMRTSPGREVFGILGSPVLDVVYWYPTPLTPVVLPIHRLLLLLATIVSLC
jgi:hypothetical protein